MVPLLTLLNNFVFTGVSGNAAFGLLASGWQRVRRKDWETLYLDAFAKAVKEEQPRLSRYGEVKFNRGALRRALHQDASTFLNRPGPTGLSSANWWTRLRRRWQRRPPPR